jgi:FkbM family methyltransferase
MRKIFNIRPKPYKKSYSQLGEDLVLDFLLNQINIDRPYYVDIGSNDPMRFSNTYFFYLKGSSGVCVDPNPIFKNLYKTVRPNDVFINAGISSKTSGNSLFYNMDWHEFSTFDKEQAEKVQEIYQGRNNINSIINLPIMSVNSLMSKLKKPVDLLSLDVEGLDFEIIQNWDFENHAPKFICVESKDIKTGKSDNRVHELIVSRKYSLVAKNLINHIYSK